MPNAKANAEPDNIAVVIKTLFKAKVEDGSVAGMGASRASLLLGTGGGLGRTVAFNSLPPMLG